MFQPNYAAVLSESVKFTDEEYLKLKKFLEENKTKETDKALECLNEIKAQKDANFQRYFKELWPNLHNRLNDPTLNSIELLKSIEEERKKRIEHQLNEDLAKYSKQATYVYTPPFNCACNNYPKVQILQPVCNCTLGCTAAPQPKSSTVNLAYDMPFSVSKYKDDLVKSVYNDSKLIDEKKTLQAIKDMNDELRRRNKIDETNYLVSEILKKVETITGELEAKEKDLKIKERVSNLKLLKSMENLRLSQTRESFRPRIRSKSPKPILRKHSPFHRHLKSAKTEPRIHHHHYYDPDLIY